MPEEDAARTAACRCKFLVAYREGKLDELRREIRRAHRAEKSRLQLQGNTLAIKHGASSKRVIWCMRYGSLDEWRAWLRRINDIEERRKVRRAASS